MNSFFQVAEIELTYKSKVKASDRPQIVSSKNAFDILLFNWSDQIEVVEEFNILLLNQANRVIGFFNVSKGGKASTVVDAKVVFAAALKGNAVSLICAHNHPSYNLTPSLQDIALTKKLVEGAKLLDLRIFDHLIITPVDYYSFADEGKI
ncbi:MAG: RadC family protein [Saprospiraceae bacterium]